MGESVESSYSGGCWIPAPVLADDNLSAAQKIFCGRIHALSRKEGYAWQSDEAWAAEFDVSERTIRRWVDSLSGQDHVEVKHVGIADGGRIRRLYPQNPSLKPDRTEMSSRGGERTSVSTRTDDDVHPNGQKRPVHKESTERSLQKGEKHKGDSPKKKGRISPCEECGDPTILDTCDSCASTARTV